MTKQSLLLSTLILAGSPATWLRTRYWSAIVRGIFFLSVEDIYRRISSVTKVGSFNAFFYPVVRIQRPACIAPIAVERRAWFDTPPNPLSPLQVACAQRGNACARGLERKAGMEVERDKNVWLRKIKRQRAIGNWQKEKMESTNGLLHPMKNRVRNDK